MPNSCTYMNVVLSFFPLFIVTLWRCLYACCYWSLNLWIRREILFEELLQEQDEVVARRKHAKEVLRVLRQAVKVCSYFNLFMLREVCLTLMTSIHISTFTSRSCTIELSYYDVSLWTETNFLPALDAKWSWIRCGVPTQDYKLGYWC